MENRIFRAKEFHTGKWIYGSLLIGARDCFICWEKSLNNFETTKVNPATIGQCVNYRDVYGEILFEGDIITSFYGFEYLIVLSHRGFKVESEAGFLFDLESICQPLKMYAVHDKI